MQTVVLNDEEGKSMVSIMAMYSSLWQALHKSDFMVLPTYVSNLRDQNILSNPEEHATLRNYSHIGNVKSSQDKPQLNGRSGKHIGSGGKGLFKICGLASFLRQHSLGASLRLASRP
eukprot:640291-Amphidinium_carterae.1